MSEVSAIIGAPIARVDGPAKVHGQARYAAEFALPGLLYGVMVTSRIASGRIRALHVAEAEALPGVRLVMTHANAPRVEPTPTHAGFADKVLSLLQDDVVRHDGQPIALVVADSFETATHGAALVRAEYDETPPVTTFAAARAAGLVQPIDGKRGSYARGDADAAFAAAPVTVDLKFTSPIQHHNPIEPHASIASWEGGRLTVWDSHQDIDHVRNKMGRVFGLTQADVRVITKFVGGAFGCKGSTWSHTGLAAMAAKMLGRPVKVVVQRQQMFTTTGYRAEMELRVALGAERDGRLVAQVHESANNVSRFDAWNEAPGEFAEKLYACPNMRMHHELIRLDVNTPTFMRAPGEAVGTFVLESAMDELAHRTGVDPVALRLLNYAETDPSSGKPWSSKNLRACYQEGTRRFGWERRPAMGAARDGHLLVGWGMATAVYPVRRFKNAAARIRLYADGTVLAESGMTDLGTGSYTVMTQVAADALGTSVDTVRFDLGDSDFPQGGPSGGSMGAGSTSAAVHNTGLALRAQLIALAIADAKSPLHGLAAEDVTAADGVLSSRHDPALKDAFTEVMSRAGRQQLNAYGTGEYGSDDFATDAFGAQFAEVRVDPDFGTVRVVRQLGVFSAGRILNARTARSQLMGGMVWGLGLALMEGTTLDRRFGRYTTKDLAEALVPVNADVGEIEVVMLPEEDPHVNPIGVKGLGEIGVTGAAAAIANAVFNATGKRVVDLPILPERLV